MDITKLKALHMKVYRGDVMEINDENMWDCMKDWADHDELE